MLMLLHTPVVSDCIDSNVMPTGLTLLLHDFVCHLTAGWSTWQCRQRDPRQCCGREDTDMVSGQATHRKPQVPGQHSEFGQRVCCAGACRRCCRSRRRSVSQDAVLCDNTSRFPRTVRAHQTLSSRIQPLDGAASGRQTLTAVGIDRRAHDRRDAVPSTADHVSVPHLMQLTEQRVRALRYRSARTRRSFQ